MKASVKICEKCLRNQKFCVHLLLRTDTNIVSQKHNNADNKALPFVHFYYGSRVGSQNLTGQRLFCCHILKLLTDKCEPKLKALRRIIVPLLHPYLNYRTSSISQTERSQNLFAELNPFRIFVMRQNRIARFTKYIKAFFGRISVALLLRVVAVLSQELGVRPLFMQLTDLCSTKCDRTTQAVRRIIVPLLHLYPNYRTSLTSRTERSQNLFAKFKTLSTFVSANVIYKVHVVYLYRSIAGFLRSYFVRHVCQNTRGLRSFCTHTLTNFCTSQWQTWTRVVFQRKALILLHSLYNRLNLSSISQIGRSQSVYNHSLWTILKSSPRCFVYLCMSF